MYIYRHNNYVKLILCRRNGIILFAFNIHIYFYIAQGWTKEDDILDLPLDLLAIDTHAAAVENVHSKFSKVNIMIMCNERN